MQEPSGKNKKDNNGILSKLIDKINLTHLKLSKKEKNRRIYDDWDNDSYEIDNAHSLEDYYKNKETVFCKENGLIEPKPLSDPRKIYGQSNQKFLQWSLIAIFIFSVIGVGLYKYYFKYSYKEPYFLQNRNIQNTNNIEVENKYQANTEDVKASFKNLINEESDTISKQESDYLNDELKDISFDFSPIISNLIAKKPQLPNRVKSKKVNNKTVSDLNSIWNTGDVKSIKI